MILVKQAFSSIDKTVATMSNVFLVLSMPLLVKHQQVPYTYRSPPTKSNQHNRTFIAMNLFLTNLYTTTNGASNGDDTQKAQPHKDQHQRQQCSQPRVTQKNMIDDPHKWHNGYHNGQYNNITAPTGSRNGRHWNGFGHIHHRTRMLLLISTPS